MDTKISQCPRRVGRVEDGGWRMGCAQSMTESFRGWGGDELWTPNVAVTEGGGERAGWRVGCGVRQCDIEL